MTSLRKRLRGFSIVAAIFILLVLSALGAFVVSVSSEQQLAASLDQQGARAYQAARAGLEWAVYQLGPDASAATHYCGGTVGESFALPATTSLQGFTVTVQCDNSSPVTDGIRVYRLTVTACNQPKAGEPRCPNASTNIGYIERQLSAAVPLSCGACP